MERELSLELPCGVLMVVQKGSRQHARKLLSSKLPD